MNDFIKRIIDESFCSKRQSRYSYTKNGDRSISRRQRYSDNPEAEEVDEISTETQEIPSDVQEIIGKKKEKIQKPSSHDKGNTKVYPTRPTPWSKYVKKPKEKEVNEIVDEDGDIKTGNEPGNPNAYIMSKKTSDAVASATMGQMGSFGILGGNTSGNKTLKYWAESDMSKALGAKDTILNPDVDNYDDAKEHFEDDLEVPEDEAEDRIEKLGYDKELPDGKIRLIENPKKYIEEYLAQRSKVTELVPKAQLETEKKIISPIIRRQLGSIKQTLKNNNLTVADITEYLEDNE